MKKYLIGLGIFAIAATAGATMIFNDNSYTNLGHFTQAYCNNGVDCSVSGGSILIQKLRSAPTKQSQTGATATTITAAQCGTSFHNSGAVQMELPASTVALYGCRLTFNTDNASNFDINPGDLDYIRGLTNAVGDAIRNATIGNSVTLELIGRDWIPVAIYGTWSDIN